MRHNLVPCNLTDISTSCAKGCSRYTHTQTQIYISEDTSAQVSDGQAEALKLCSIYMQAEGSSERALSYWNLCLLKRIWKLFIGYRSGTKNIKKTFNETRLQSRAG